jgi:superfamily II DNA/RNA helicase
MSTFLDLNLHGNITKAITACGYTTPTPVQAKTIPHIIEGKDVVASARTGTGKTAAFVLPALHRLNVEPASKKTRILILTPTRELAAQITNAATQYGKFSKFNVVNLVGGMPYHQQIRELARGADIIVATPGRLLDHIESKRVDLSHIEMLVLDEADRMLDMGFIDDVEYIAKLTPAYRQTLLFSATVDKQLTTVVRHLLKNPVRVDLSTENMTVPQIEQKLYRVSSPHQKAALLKQLCAEENIFKAIIFCATKISADRIADKLEEEGFAAAALHGDLRQNVRNRTVEQLRRGKIQFLVATDVAARGIDISDITHVINYDIPRFCEDYVHRIGRTGRAGKSGVAISFIAPTDMSHVKRIERFIGQRLTISNAPHSTGHHASDDADEVIHRPRKSASTHSRRDDEPRREARHDRKPAFRSERSERPAFRDRGDKPAFRGNRGDKPSFRDRSEKPSFRSIRADSDRSERPAFRDRKDKPAFRGNRDDSDRSERPAFRDRKDKPAFRGNRGDSDRSERPAFRDRKDKPAFRSSRGDSDRSERPAFRDRKDKPAFRGNRGDSDHSERPAFRHRKEKPTFSGNRGNSDRSERPAFRDRKDKPAFRSNRGDSDRPVFLSDRKDKPVAVRTRNSGDRKDKPAFRKNTAAGDKPFKRRVKSSEKF